MTEVGISSLADAWLMLRDIEIGGERNRGLYILKSRGMAHSNQIREFLLTDKGINLLDVYVGPSGVLTGSARLSQESQEKAAKITQQQEIELKKRNLESRKKALEAQVAALHAEMEAGTAEMKRLTEQEKGRQRRLLNNQKAHEPDAQSGLKSGR
jgi:circadian clock protein KaiC